MVAPRRPSRSRPHAPRPVAPAAAKARLPSAPKEPEKFDPNKPLKNVRAGQDDSKPDLGNPYFPRYGSIEAHNFFVRLGIEEFLAKQTGKNALKLAKVWSHFMQAALGVARVPRPRVDVTFLQTQIDPDLAPDVAESEFKSKSPGADWNSHYDMVAAQMHKGASSTYSA